MNKNDRAAAAKQILLAQTYLWNGHRNEAIHTADRAVALDKGEAALHAAGSTYTEAGQSAKALAIASQLAVRVEPEPQLYGKLLQAGVALKRGDFRTAISLINSVQQISDTWMGVICWVGLTLKRALSPNRSGLVTLIR